MTRIQDHEPQVDGHCDSTISLGCSCGWNEWDATTRRENPAQFSEAWWEHIAADSLDAAWQEAEAALPEGWRITAVTSAISESRRAPFKARAAGPRTPAGPLAGRVSVLVGGTATPAAALRALAAKLREVNG